MTASAEVPSFTELALERLRAGHFRPLAWVNLIAASWQQARVTASAQPRLTQSWRWLASGLSVATVLEVARTMHLQGPMVAGRVGAMLSIATVAQAGDIFVHLGMHRPAGSRPFQQYPRLGLANWLTATRGWVASWLWSRLVANQPMGDGELILALALITVTDITDGPVARAMHTTSALGRYLDGAADVLVWSALTLTQVRRQQIPAWLAGVFAVRWLAPLALGFGRTFAGAQPVALVPSAVGRAAGALQTATQVTGLLGSLRSRQLDGPLWQRIQNGLARITAAFLLAALGVQVARLTRAAGNTSSPRQTVTACLNSSM